MLQSIIQCGKMIDLVSERDSVYALYFGTIEMLLGGWCRWALVSPYGVDPSRIVSVSASINLPCTIKSRSSLLAPAHLDGPKKGP